MKKRKRLKVMNEKVRHTQIPSISLVEIGGKSYPNQIMLRNRKLIQEVCDLAEQADTDPATYITELVVDWIVENRRKVKDPDPFRHGNSHYDEVWDKDAMGAYT